MRVAAPAALVPLERLGHREPRQHLRPHGGVIREAGPHDRHPHHVALLNAAVDVHIGVMRAGAVFDGVLQEAEALQANPTEGRVVHAAGLARGRGTGTGRLVSMHVEKFNPALQLYERLGFQIAGDRDAHWLLHRAPVS